VPAGFLLWRYYRGPATSWFRFYLTGVIYVLIWSLVFFFFRPSRTNVVRIPLVVLVVTCALEFLQLYNPLFLQQIRATLIGAVVIGTDFVWMQFPYYFLGCALSILLLKLLSDSRNK
jgi:hypothetical protein